MNTVKCPDCGHENRNTNIKCESCGKELIKEKQTRYNNPKKGNFIVVFVILFTLGIIVSTSLSFAMAYIVLKDFNDNYHENYITTDAKFVGYDDCSDLLKKIKFCNINYEYVVNDVTYTISLKQDFFSKPEEIITVSYNPENPSEQSTSIFFDRLVNAQNIFNTIKGITFAIAIIIAIVILKKANVKKDNKESKA